MADGGGEIECSAWLTALGLALQAWLRDGIW